MEHYTNIFSIDAKGTGAGGAFTTVLDVERFWQGIFSGKLVSSETRGAMLQPQVTEQCYGYGFWMENRGGRPIPYFTGSDPGVSFQSSFDADNRLCVTLVSNFGSDVWKIHREICAAIA